MNSGFVYTAADVSGLLGLPAENAVPPPEVVPKIKFEIVTYYAGWSLADLRASRAGQRLMDQHVWCDRYVQAADPGHYRVLLRVPGSCGRTYRQQVAHLAARSGGRWHPAPVAVAATALLVHLAATGQDVLQLHSCSCRERTDDDYQLAISTLNKVVSIGGHFGSDLSYRQCLAASCKC